jgi:hypothetical protein
MLGDGIFAFCVFMHRLRSSGGSANWSICRKTALTFEAVIGHPLRMVEHFTFIFHHLSAA